MFIEFFGVKKMLSKVEILETLSNFTGSEHYYRHPLNVIYTDGIKYLADTCECYWLIDAVASWQFEDKVKQEEFQVIKLKVNEDNSALLTIDDGNDNVIATQIIEYTDFPLPEIVVWFENGVLYLPTEH